MYIMYIVCACDAITKYIATVGPHLSGPQRSEILGQPNNLWWVHVIILLNFLG